jgi:hypothetical protein
MLRGGQMLEPYWSAQGVLDHAAHWFYSLPCLAGAGRCLGYPVDQSR